MKGQPREYPPATDVIAAATTLRSVNRLADHFGYPESSFRRWLQRTDHDGRKLIDWVQEQFVRPYEQSTPALGETVSREEMLEQELAEARRQLQKARSDDVKFERVLTSLETYLPRAVVTYQPKPLPQIRRRKRGHTLALLWSDQHAAEVVSLEQTTGINEYNWDVMMARHDELRRGIASWAEVFAPVDELVVCALGDGLSGNIHEELAETNEMPLAEACVQWGVDGAQWLASLLDIVPKIRFAGVVGNHPRAHKKPRAKHKHDNADWVSYHVMRQSLSRESRISFEIPTASKHLINIYDQRILLMHGDAIPPSAMVGVPWGGVIRMDARLRNQYARRGTPYDHLFMGHLHEANAIARKIFINGSVKGPDEYGLERYGDGQEPIQLLVPYHPERGVVGAEYIDLDPDPPTGLAVAA